MDFRTLEFTWPTDPALVAQAIARHGCAVVRGCLDGDRLAEAAAAARERFRFDDEAKRERRLEPERAWEHRFGVLSPLRVFGSAAAALRFVRAFAAGSPLLDLAHAFFGAPLLAEPKRIIFRRQSPGNRQRQIPYHQDFYTQTPGVRGVLNFWIPFDRCGVDAPGLEVVPHVFDRLLERRDMPLIPDNASFDKIHIERGTVEALCGPECFWHPPMAPGDTLVFSEYVVHRTHVTGAMTRERASMEFRLISTASITPEYSGPADRFVPMPH